MSNPIKLGTHSGTFHADEVLATAILQQLYPSSTLTRTRDQSILNTLDIIYDVGSIFNHTLKRYDHHQRGFSEHFPNKKILLSSSGLIYKYYGKQLLLKLGASEEQLDILFNFIYEDYFMGFDAADNGNDGIYGELFIRNCTSVVSSFNYITEDEDGNFRDAVDFMRGDLLRYLEKAISTFNMYYKGIVDAVVADKSYLIIDRVECPLYFIHYFINTVENKVKFLISKYTDGYCRIYGHRLSLYGYKCEGYLKEEWRGLKGEELEKIGGVSGMAFVHGSGFTGAAENLEVAIKMVEMSLNE